MAGLLEKIHRYFTEPPLLRAALQVNSSYVSGIHLLPGGKKLKAHFILPLRKGVVEPSFEKKNIVDSSILEKRFREGLEKFFLPDGDIALLVPELCLKIFVFSFDSFPPSSREKEKIIRWRVKKQMPSLPEDARFSYDAFKGGPSPRLVAALARNAVIKEYEDFMSRLGLRVRAVGVPSLNLIRLANLEGNTNSLVANIEEDHISLVAFGSADVFLYRLKTFSSDRGSGGAASPKFEDMAKEVENTVRFLEDREGRKINTIWVRQGLLEEGDVLPLLRERLPLPLKPVEPAAEFGLDPRMNNVLSPLIGEVL